MKIEHSKSVSDALKLIGVVSMLIDHAGFIFLPQFLFLRIIGRLAFPIFAAGIVVGFQHTSDLKKYALRLFLFGLLAQIPFQYLLGEFRLNIMFTLLLGLLLIYFFDTKKYLLFAIVAVLPFVIPIEYEIFGPAVIFSFYFLKTKKQILLAYVVMVLMYLVIKNQTGYLFFVYSIFGTALALYPKILEYWKAPKLSRYFFYIFYPAHLALFALIKYLIH